MIEDQMIAQHGTLMRMGLADSSIASTRVWWRKRFGCTDEQANDPRPLVEVLEQQSSTAAT